MLQDAIYRDLIQDEASVTNGAVFRDYVLTPNTSRVEEVEVVVDSGKSGEADSKMRVWISTAGKEVEAGYVAVVAEKVVLKTSRGKQLKIPLAKLSPADREYIELINPPKFAIDFVKHTMPPRVNDFTFGAKVKQRGAGAYNHELTVEYFAIGKERLGNKYVLLDRQSSTFIPTKENERSHGFKGNSIEFVEYDLDGLVRGKRPDGNLVTLTDKRGHVIQYSASKAWLRENIENLKRLPVGAYMDETCARAYPTSPKPTKW